MQKGNKIDTPLTEVNFYQIPHHGSRHNLSPSIMNKMVGNIVSEGIKLKKLLMNLIITRKKFLIYLFVEMFKFIKLLIIP